MANHGVYAGANFVYVVRTFGEQREKTFPIPVTGEEVTVGRAADNVICLPDQAASTHGISILRPVQPIKRGPALVWLCGSDTVNIAFERRNE